jgi:hypothetical protein
MKIPISKLPWRFNEGRDGYYMGDMDNSLICSELYQSDAEYIEEACNNYPKAIELLEKCINSMSLQVSNVQEEQDLMDEITDLLNTTYND